MVFNLCKGHYQKIEVGGYLLYFGGNHYIYFDCYYPIHTIYPYYHLFIVSETLTIL